MGILYRLPKLNIDTSISAYNSETPSPEQLAAFNNIKDNGLPTYGVVSTIGQSITTYLATSGDDFIIAFYYMPSENDFGYYTKCNGATIYASYDRANPMNYGYNIISINTGIIKNSFPINRYSSVQMLVDYYSTSQEAYNAIADVPVELYPITYSYSNSTVSGPSEAAIGDTVIVSAVPDVGYGITDASTQILVTNNDVAVPYTWDAANQRITFTMPDPS